METLQVLTFLCIFILIILGAVHLLVNLIWYLFPIFNGLNILIWWLSNPVRRLYRNNKKSYPRYLYGLFFPFYVIWLFLFYMYSSPFRYIISFYYNILLFLSVCTRDALSDVFAPKFSFKYSKGVYYYIAWCFGLPLRALVLLIRQGGIILQAFLMFIIDCVFPSFTMYHGTSLGSSSIPILKKSKWYVGMGDYVGYGIYFAISRKVAEHYAGNNDPSVIVCRVNLFPLRPVATLTKGTRELAGSGGYGNIISSNAGITTASLEHWRNNRGGWYEYCLLQANRAGRYISTWRIRPICILKKNNNSWFFARIIGGGAFWPNSISSLLLSIIAIVILYFQFLLFISLI